VTNSKGHTFAGTKPTISPIMIARAATGTFMRCTLLDAVVNSADHLTTEAQRPGLWDAWIGTTAQWPGSLQRMVRPRS